MPLAHPSVGEVMNAPIRVLVRRLVHLVPRSQSHSVLSSMAIRRASSRSEIRCGRLPRDPQERQEGNASDSTRGLLPTSRTSADLEGESRVEAAAMAEALAYRRGEGGSEHWRTRGGCSTSNTRRWESVGARLAVRRRAAASERQNTWISCAIRLASKFRWAAGRSWHASCSAKGQRGNP